MLIIKGPIEISDKIVRDINNKGKFLKIIRHSKDIKKLNGNLDLIGFRIEVRTKCSFNEHYIYCCYFFI